MVGSWFPVLRVIAHLPAFFFAPYFPSVVVLLTALGQTEHDFGDAASKVNLQWYDGKSPLSNLDAKAVYDVFVKEQLSRSQGGVIEMAGLVICCDVGTGEKKLTVLKSSVAVDQIRFSLTERFYFRADEHQAGLHGAFDPVVPMRATISAYDFDIGIFGGLFFGFLAH
jgi:hypothetical protein